LSLQTHQDGDVIATLLAGCVNSTTKNLHLLSLQYDNTKLAAKEDSSISKRTIAYTISNSSSAGGVGAFEVRAGYMGLCVLRETNLQFCSTEASNLIDLIRKQTSLYTEASKTQGKIDLLDLVYIANHFKKKIIFDGLM
jgi:hypothetical protein